MFILHRKREEFAQPANDDVLVYTTNQLNYNDWILDVGEGKWKTNYLSLESAQTIYDFLVSKKEFPSNILPSYDSVVWIASELQYEQYIKNTGKTTSLVATKDAYFIAMGIPEEIYSVECAFHLEGKVVGYLDDIDKHFIRSILYAYRIPLSSVKLVQIPLKEWGNMGKYMASNKVNLIIAHVVPGSPLHGLIKTQYISIMGWGNMDIDRIRMFNPYLAKEDIDLKQLFMTGDLQNSSLVMNREKRGPVIRIKIGMYALTKLSTKETFISRLEITPDVYDPAYRCYGDMSIEQKALCTSPYNQQGDPKNIPTHWDKPCIRDSDCPFFQANTNYKNSRGGCLIGGICEMPTGVLRTAFRTYDDSGIYAPFCYQCSDAECCKRQKRPDYAFPDDLSDRQKAGLPTYVPIV